jgi:hypothetical protein
MKKYLALVVIAAALSASPALAGWTVQKSEADPFAPHGESTFIAMELGERSGLSIRCLEGTISLLLVVQASGASQGDPASVKLIADAKGVLDDNDAQVISATPLLTGVQFGDESTLDYLKGAQKLSLRYELRGFAATVSFAGGTSMDGIIDKALKACAKASEPQAPPPSVSTTAQPGSPEWARASDACPRPYNFVADENDKWTCVKETGSTPPSPTTEEPQASPRAGKACSGIPKEQRTLDCAPVANRDDPRDKMPPVGPERCQWAMAHGYIFDGKAAGCLPDQHLK